MAASGPTYLSCEDTWDQLKDEVLAFRTIASRFCAPGEQPTPQVLDNALARAKVDKQRALQAMEEEEENLVGTLLQRLEASERAKSSASAGGADYGMLSKQVEEMQAQVREYQQITRKLVVVDDADQPDPRMLATALEKARKDKEKALQAMEEEEEQIANRLISRVRALQREKVALENSLSQEAEFLCNRLSRQLAESKAEAAQLRGELEQLRAKQGSLEVSPDEQAAGADR
mmetsp:Transcript_18237/g.40309  ORF Transcript_18237/g.40309 Transcript_18237/m.40309 type:complete len:232 (-) Transcript_18237:289-984(-)